MTRSHPETHAERDAALHVIEQLCEWEETPPWMREEISGGVLRSGVRYKRALLEHRIASRGLDRARKQTEEEFAVFCARFRAWSNDLFDKQGRSRSHERRVLFDGMLPSRLLKQRYQVILARLTGIEELLQLWPGLRGDEGKLRAFLAAIEPFERRVAALEASERELSAARDAAAESAARFDADWRGFVKLLKGARPALAEIFLPAFRKPKRKASSSPSSQADREEQRDHAEHREAEGEGSEGLSEADGRDPEQLQRLCVLDAAHPVGHGREVDGDARDRHEAHGRCVREDRARRTAGDREPGGSDQRDGPEDRDEDHGKTARHKPRHDDLRRNNARRDGS